MDDLDEAGLLAEVHLEDWAADAGVLVLAGGSVGTPAGAERDLAASVAIASNESFSGWNKIFTDPRLCAAIVDRLTFDGTIIETGTDSYRLAHTIRRLDARPD